MALDRDGVVYLQSATGFHSSGVFGDFDRINLGQEKSGGPKKQVCSEKWISMSIFKKAGKFRLFFTDFAAIQDNGISLIFSLEKNLEFRRKIL